jgi:hypothetical protein
MTPRAAHSGGLGQPTLSLPRPAQLILSAPVRPAQLIFMFSPVWAAQLIPSAPVRPAQLIFIPSRVRPAQQITCVLSWF